MHVTHEPWARFSKTRYRWNPWIDPSKFVTSETFFHFWHFPIWQPQSYADVNILDTTWIVTFQSISRHENLTPYPNASRQTSKNVILLITAPPSGQIPPNFIGTLWGGSRCRWPNLVFGSQSAAEIWANALFGGVAANSDWLTWKVGISCQWGHPLYLWIWQFHFKYKHFRRYEQKQCFANYSAP